MKVATVVGTVVSTINHPFFDGHRLLICDVATGAGATGAGAVGGSSGYTIAVDLVDAGVGETVLVLDEGNSARQLFDIDTGPIRAVVVGIVDDWNDDE